MKRRQSGIHLINKQNIDVTQGYIGRNSIKEICCLYGNHAYSLNLNVFRVLSTIDGQQIGII